MSGTVVIVIMVAAGYARSPETSGVLSAATEALGSGASIVLESVGTPTDRSALRVEKRLQAAAVVELVWATVKVKPKRNVRPTALLRVHLAVERRWIERQVTFAAKDTALERGRTIGFTLASILVPKIEIPRPPPPSPESEPEPAAVADTNIPSRKKSPPPDSASVEGRRGAATGARPAPVPSPPKEAAPTEPDPPAEPSAESTDDAVGDGRPRLRPPSPPWQYGIQVGGVAAIGIGAPAQGYGAAAHLEVSPRSVLGLRLGGGIRAGNVPALEGNNIEAWGGLGAFWRPAALDGRRVGAGLHVDALVLLHDLTHEAGESGTPTHLRKLMPGAFLGMEGAWHMASWVDVLLSVGVETAFGKTPLAVGMTPKLDKGTLPIFRGLSEAGFRLHF